VFVGGGFLPRAESASPDSPAHQGLPQAKLDYPDKAGGENPALIPLSGYTTEKGKTLARKYRSQLLQVIGELEKKYSLSQMEIRAVGFLKSPQCGQKDDRHLSVIVEVSEEYGPGKATIGKRAGTVFGKYVPSIAKVLLQHEDVLEDRDVEGIAICPNWMLKQTGKAPHAGPVSEGMFVCVPKKIGREFFQNKINLHQLASKAKVYARQGDAISPLTDIQIRER
jgi:hypothetical protein